MRYQIYTGSKAKEFIDKLDRIKRARIDRLYDLFEVYGTFLSGKYLKKIVQDIWELRPGDVRLFLTIRGNKAFVVHGILKKTQKTPRQDVELAIRRVQEEKL